MWILVDAFYYQEFYEQLAKKFRKKWGDNCPYEWSDRGLWTLAGDETRTGFKATEIFGAENAYSHEYFWQRNNAAAKAIEKWEKQENKDKCPAIRINATALKKALEYLGYKISKELSGESVGDKTKARNLWGQFSDSVTDKLSKSNQPNLLEYAPQFSNLLIGPLNLQPRNFEIRVHHQLDKFEVIDETINRYFTQINAQRELKGERSFPTPLRYWLIGYEWNKYQLTIHVAPANYAYLAVYNQFKNVEEIHDYFKLKILEQTAEIKKEDENDSIIFTDSGFVLLGTECSILTRDNFCFIRKRGQHTLLEQHKWSTGLSGYIGNISLSNPHSIDVVDFLRENLKNKISDIISADPLKIKITGLHQNTETNAADILCYWRLDMSAKQLIKQISGNEKEIGEIFSTNNYPNDSFVRDSHNLLFPMKISELEGFFKERNILEKQFVPESLISLQLAINGTASK